MLKLVTGSDRAATAAAARKILTSEKCTTVTITDTHTLEDLKAALFGGGMFDTKKVVFLDGVFARPEMRDEVVGSLARLKESAQLVVLREEKIDADTKKKLEKYAETSEKFELKKEKKETTIFALANALQKKDKKALWVGLQYELAEGAAPEAIHGVLFWAAKQHHMRTGTTEAARSIEILAELPHEARRRGVELEYALEKFALSLL